MGRKKKKAEAKRVIPASRQETSMRQDIVHEKSLAHDVREINRQLKGHMERVSQAFKEHRNVLGDQERHVKSASVLTEMLTNRLDVYDFYMNRGSFNPREVKLCLHRELTKVCRVLATNADKKKLRVTICESRVEVWSSYKFASALFVIMENAMKYSPNSASIDVTISDDDRKTCIYIANYGPQLSDNEVKSVFKYGFRGEKSKQYAKTGSGIGMHYAKEMCDLHFFTIDFVQNRADSLSRDGVDFAKMTTQIEIPKSPTSLLGAP